MSKGYIGGILILVLIAYAFHKRMWKLLWVVGGMLALYVFALSQWKD